MLGRLAKLARVALAPPYHLYATISSYVTLVSWQFVRTLLHDHPDAFFVQDYATGRFDVLLFIAKVLRIPLIAYHSGNKPDWYQGGIYQAIDHSSC